MWQFSLTPCPSPHLRTDPPSRSSGTPCTTASPQTPPHTRPQPSPSIPTRQKTPINEVRPAVLDPDCGRDVLCHARVRVYALLILGAGAFHGVQLNVRRLLCRNRHGPLHGAGSPRPAPRDGCGPVSLPAEREAGPRVSAGAGLHRCLHGPRCRKQRIGHIRILPHLPVRPLHSQYREQCDGNDRGYRGVSLLNCTMQSQDTRQKKIFRA